MFTTSKERDELVVHTTSNVKGGPLHERAYRAKRDVFKLGAVVLALDVGVVWRLVLLALQTVPLYTCTWVFDIVRGVGVGMGVGGQEGVWV